MIGRCRFQVARALWDPPTEALPCLRFGSSFLRGGGIGILFWYCSCCGPPDTTRRNSEPQKGSFGVAVVPP